MMNCYLYDAPSYLIFASGVPELLYYSHLPALALSLFVGFFIYFHKRDSLLNQLLLLICLVFSAWLINSLLGWTNIHADLLAFLWPMYGITSSLLAILCIYFTYVFIDRKDIKIRNKIIFLLLLAPVLLFSHTDLSVSGFNLANCDAFEFEGLWYKKYFTAIGFIAMLWIAALLVKRYRVAELAMKRQILLIGIGVEFFLASFISLTFVTTYLVNLGYLEDSRFEMYGLFGMMVFLAVIGILTVQYRTFSVGVLGAQALLIALIVLVGSQLTFAETGTATTLSLLTLFLTCVSGVLLNRSVKKEVKQREQLEELTHKLEHANERLQELDKLKSEFVSIASHQLRSPLTAIRGYASMLAEGSFGKLPEKAQESAERIAESARLMAISVEDYLNVSRIESGNMKYEYSDFNLRDRLEELTDELRPVALKKGLILLFRTNLNSRSVVHADLGKTVQMCHNLINNSIKYTEKGTVSIFLRDDITSKKIYMDVTDTGIGMSPKTLQSIFQKFSRAEGANKVNASGTGLGLFVASKMAEAMGGSITAHSDGEGKGSTFTLELPLAM